MRPICIDDAGAMVGSPCHWISEKMCTGRLVDCGLVRNSAKLMSENEMMKAKIAPETRLDGLTLGGWLAGGIAWGAGAGARHRPGVRNSGNVTMKNARTRVAPRLIA